MEREQIIKALEFCAEHEYCVSCPCDNECIGMESLMLDALSLIKELNEEIEGLEASIKILVANNATLETELAETYDLLEDAKADTVRKMLKMVKRRASTIGNSYANGETVIIQYFISPQALDQIAKEMLEDGILSDEKAPQSDE